MPLKVTQIVNLVVLHNYIANSPSAHIIRPNTSAITFVHLKYVHNERYFLQLPSPPQQSSSNSQLHFVKETFLNLCVLYSRFLLDFALHSKLRLF